MAITELDRIPGCRRSLSHKAIFFFEVVGAEQTIKQRHNNRFFMRLHLDDIAANDSSAFFRPLQSLCAPVPSRL